MNFNLKTVLQKFATYVTPKSYRGIQDNGTNRYIPSVVKSQDKHLNQFDRLSVAATNYDLERNCGIVVAAANIHTDFVSQFNFQVKSGNKVFDKQVQQKMKWWSRPGNCDITKRFSFRQLRRLIEKSRFMQGDVLVIKTEGTKLQVVQGDRICNPDIVPDKFKKNFNLKKYQNGIRIDDYTGQVVQYLICSRTSGNTRQLQAIIKAQDAILVAYRPRIDSYRGISPLVSAINNCKDLMDSQKFQLMKIRLTALLGFALLTKSNDPLGRDTTNGQSTFNIDYSGETPTFFRLKPGDDVKVIQGAVPRTETANFYKDITLQIFRTLGLPYSFYSQDFSNFFGSRGALMRFEQSLKPKRQGMTIMLDDVTRWLIANWILDGSIVLPDNMNINDIKFEWIAPGVAAWKPTQQIQGYLMAVGAGLISIERAAKELGGDYEQNIDQLKQNYKYAKDAQVPIFLNINTIASDINTVVKQNANNEGTNNVD